MFAILLVCMYADMLYECLYECRWEVPGIQRSSRGRHSRGTRFWRSSRSQQYTRTNQLISDGLIKGQHLKTKICVFLPSAAVPVSANTTPGEAVYPCRVCPLRILWLCDHRSQGAGALFICERFSSSWYARRLRAVYCNALVSSCRHMWMFPFMGMGRQRPTPAPSSVL